MLVAEFAAWIRAQHDSRYECSCYTFEMANFAYYITEFSFKITSTHVYSISTLTPQSFHLGLNICFSFNWENRENRFVRMAFKFEGVSIGPRRLTVLLTFLKYANCSKQQEISRLSLGISKRGIWLNLNLSGFSLSTT